MPERTVSAGFAGAFAEFAVSRGADRARLLASAGVSADALAEQDRRIPFISYVTLIRVAKTLCGDPALALEFGAATDYRGFSILGLIVHAARDMRDGLAQMNRYGRLAMEVEVTGDGPRFELVPGSGEGGEGAHWFVDHRAHPNDCPEITEATFSRQICGTRSAFPGLVVALAAEVTHPAPAYADAYERIWGVPVRFGAARNAFLTPVDFDAVPVAPESRYVFGVLTERGDALLDELNSSKTLRGRVESLLMPRLHTGDVGVESVARQLGTSRQTVYRGLRAEGVTFEQVLDDLRHRMALHYLAGGQASVNEIAYLVGFSEASAFSRAFKRWTGVSPRDARVRPNR